MQLTEESGVQDLALGDCARARMLDGYWFSPDDIWYQYSVPSQPAVVPAIHPCPWTRERSLSNASSSSSLSRRNIPKDLHRESAILLALQRCLRRPPAANARSAASSAQERRSSISRGMRCFRRAPRRPCCKSCADEHGGGPERKEYGSTALIGPNAGEVMVL